MDIGLERGLVRLVAHSQKWGELYAQEEHALRDAIGQHVLDIQHVGGTAIPGMVAKPILDIAIAVASFDEATVCIEPLRQLGYEYRSENGIPKRHYFAKGEPRTHHVHVLEIESLDWTKLITFRDALRKDAILANTYAQLKMELAQKFPNDRDAYLEGKTAFVERVNEKFIE
jgi:GrpB-like predicted nucleotidyltransferase (UPF0157 family)